MCNQFIELRSEVESCSRKLDVVSFVLITVSTAYKRMLNAVDFALFLLVLILC